MTLTGVIDDHVLARYRVLLDAEDAAFNELEHAYEDGDRDHFQADLDAWGVAIRAKLIYLRKMGVAVTLEPSAV